MKYQINNRDIKYLTDNSKESSEECAFVLTKTSKKYEEDARINGTKKFLTPQELKTIFNVENIKIVGITGTNGKTTTAALIYSILLDLGFKVALLGTRGFFINESKISDKSLTTPQLLTNYYYIDLAVQNKCDFFIMEVSSHAIEQERVESIDFALRIHTNITSDHLDYHKTLENYIAIKSSFFNNESLKLINSDDKNIVFNYKNARTYALEGNATFKLEAYSLNNGLSGVVSMGGQKGTFSSTMIGNFNLYNIIAAISAVKLITNNTLEEICDCVDNFAGVSGRMEVVSLKPLIFVDFAHTQDGIEQVLKSLYPFKIVTVFGAGGDRDKTKRAPMAKSVSKYSVRAYITSDNPRSEDPLSIIDDIALGMIECNFEKILDRKEAIFKAIDSLKEGEILAVLGKGDEVYQEINGSLIHFNDKEVILDYLNNKKS